MSEPTIILAIGGMIPIYLLSVLFGRFFFKNIEASKKIIYSTLVAYIVSLILSGFGNMSGGDISSFSPFYLEYFLSTVFLLLIRLGYLKLKKKNN